MSKRKTASKTASKITCPFKRMNILLDRMIANPEFIAMVRASILADRASSTLH
jgi:hypothetical protein